MPSQPGPPGLKINVAPASTEAIRPRSDTPIEPKSGSLGIKGSDAVPEVTPDLRALASLRPVEAMLRDPLGEVARKERRSLLGISAIAILVGWTGLVPEKIENFGIIFAAPERRALLWVFVAVVVYYTVAFIVYAFSDFLSYVYAVHQGRAELIKPPSGGVGSLRLPVDTPWSLIGYVTPASLARGVFDFIVPVLVALFAMWSLWGAITQVRTVAPNAPATTPAPSLKAPPPPASR